MRYPTLTTSRGKDRKGHFSPSGKIGMTDDDQPSNKMWGTMIIIVAVVIIIMI